MNNPAQFKLEVQDGIKDAQLLDLETRASTDFLKDMAPVGARGVKENDPLSFNETQYGENAKMNLDLNATQATAQTLKEASARPSLGPILAKGAGFIVLLIALVIGGSYVMDDPFGIIGNITDYYRKIMILFGLETENNTAQVVKKPGDAGEGKQHQVAESAPVASPAPLQSQFDARMVENPYWFLPNTPVKAEPLGVEITDDEADRWEAGLGHEFVYQHYKAVKQIRKSHARGSDHLLYQAMNDRKLWVRMEALLGLAELGVTMENSLVEKALREKRVYLLANYFRRFYDNPSASAVYIMKQALRDVKAPVRRVILENLWHLDDADTPLYLAAACYDPSSKVREWALSPPRNYSVTPFVLQRYQELVVIEWKKGSASQVAGQNGEAAEALPSFDEGDLIKNVTIAGIAVNDLPSLKKKPNAPPAPAVSAAPAPLENKEAVQDLVAPEEHKTEDGFDTLKAKDFEIKEDSAGK